MSIKDPYRQMRDLLLNITSDLDKSENGNKAASQRVRTGTVKLEKTAKLFRKESITTEKKTKDQKKSSKSSTPKKAQLATKSGAKSKASAPSSRSKTASVKAKPKAAYARNTYRSN